MTVVEAPDIDHLRSRLVGYTFPEGRVRLDAYEAWLGNDAMRARNGTGLNPAWVLILGLRGMGLTIDELVELAASTAHDGIMFGELAVEEHIPVQAERGYRVTGRITAVERKHGARSGTFDVLAFELSVLFGTELHATATCSFILPRRNR